MPIERLLILKRERFNNAELAVSMRIGGLEKFSMIDYPECLSAVVFTNGCTFCCPFCYNPLLVKYNGEKDQTLSETGLFQFLESRRGKLDGVVISGGEPTMQVDLPEFIKKIKALGFLVKLDTNGSNPEMLKIILAANLIDYLAMDIKADEENYGRATGGLVNLDKVKDSVKIIMESNLPYEFRTTCVPGFLNEEIMENMGQMIAGAEKWYLQNFKSTANLIDKNLIGQPGFTEAEMKKFAVIGKKFVKFCEVRS
ncbi:MAG: anaerobic ribonucleoside-triphosphate reductase activating protein [Patescibacteria group bacterium]